MYVLLITEMGVGHDLKLSISYKIKYLIFKVRKLFVL
jgi:hypothetical protein